jgi:hypothetical protein
LSAKYVETILIKIPVVRIPKAITENSNISLFKRNLSELSSEIILGFIIVNEYHKDNKNKTAKVEEIRP